MNRFVASMGAWPSQPPRTTMASFDGAVGMRDTVSVLGGLVVARAGGHRQPGGPSFCVGHGIVRHGVVILPAGLVVPVLGTCPLDEVRSDETIPSGPARHALTGQPDGP